MAKACPSWRELPVAAVIAEPGNIVESRTGDWRMGVRPVKDQSKCKSCYLCWVFCPDASIAIEGDTTVIDYYHCKGCGICSKVCPYGAITMAEEEGAWPGA